MIEVQCSMSIQPGKLIPRFRALSSTGQIDSQDYRQRHNLLLIFLGSPIDLAYLQRFESVVPQLRTFNTRLIAFVPEALSVDYSFPVVADPERVIYERFDVAEAALVLCDQFAEVRKIFWLPRPVTPPSVEEVLEWVEFIDLHCHECNSPLW